MPEGGGLAHIVRGLGGSVEVVGVVGEDPIPTTVIWVLGTRPWTTIRG